LLFPQPAIVSSIIVNNMCKYLIWRRFISTTIGLTITVGRCLLVQYYEEK